MLSRRSFFKRAAGLGAGATAIAVFGLPDQKPKMTSGDLTTTRYPAPNPHDFVSSHHRGDSDYYDMIVSSCWADECAAGRGVEGQTFINFWDQSFRVFSNPQDAIDAAVSGDRIFVTPGEYTGPLTMKDPSVQFTMIGSRINA